ncbi:cell division protein FtsA [candidate division KSB1 bacterium]|nr:cell division protein FtsA [candidate division KSB1 bacterium]
MTRKTFINDSLDLFNSTLEKSNGNRRSAYPDAWRQSTTGKPLRKDRELGEIIVGLDIGTNKIAVIVAEIDEIEGMKIIGVGVSPSEGLRRGVVVNLDKTVQSIEKSVKEAELMSGIEIESVYVGIAGDHIRSINSRGVVAVSGGNREISEDDVQRVIDAAKAVSLPIDREIIHVIPQEFIVDDQSGIKNPVGFSGVRLEAEVHIVTGAVTSAQNIYRCVQRTGLKARSLVLEPLASSFAVLGDDEKEIGIGLLDLGGGTTDIALIFEGSIRHTAVIGLGGKNVTNDIAQGLRTPIDRAEEIKLKYGCALSCKQMNGETIEVPGVGGRSSTMVPKSVLTEIIQPRIEEILMLAKREIQRSEYADFLNAGIVLTGGGSMLESIGELAEQIFDTPVKLGIPQGFGGLVGLARSPIHATGIGLIHYGLTYKNEDMQLDEGDESENFQSILSWMKRLVKDLF